MKVSTRHLVGSLKSMRLVTATIAAMALGALMVEPAAGGYSTKLTKGSTVKKIAHKTTKTKLAKIKKPKPERNPRPPAGLKEVHTYGIVTEITGRVFTIKPEVSAVRVGDGIKVGQVVWIEDSVRFELASVNGAEVSVSGPGVVEFKYSDRIKIHSGAVKLKSVNGANQYFESPMMAGEVSSARTAYGETGQALIWVSNQSVQILSYTGDVSVWHPHLEKAKILVPPGYFSEYSVKFSHLQPSKPKFVEEAKALEFASLFESDVVLPYWKKISHAPVSIDGDKGRSPAVADHDSHHVAVHKSQNDGEHQEGEHKVQHKTESYPSVVSREVVEKHMLKRLTGEATSETYEALVNSEQNRQIARAKEISSYKSRFSIKKEKGLSKEDKTLVHKLEQSTEHKAEHKEKDSHE